MGSCGFLSVHCVYLAPSCACQSCQGSSPGALEVRLIAPAGGKPPLPKSKLVPFMPNHIETFDVRKRQYCLCLRGQLGVYLVGTEVKSSFKGTCGKFSELAVEFVFYQLGKMLKMPYSPLPPCKFSVRRGKETTVPIAEKQKSSHNPGSLSKWPQEIGPEWGCTQRLC